MKGILPLVLLSLLVTAPLSLAQDTDQTAIGLTLKGAYTPARAMKLIYGSYILSEGSAHWTPKQQKAYPPHWPDTVRVRVLLDSSYIESGVPQHLLVTWSMPQESFDGEFTCHSCGVLIGLTLFAKDGDVWRAAASDLQFGVYGQFGMPPDVSLQRLGPERFGLVMPATFGSAGTVEESITIIAQKGESFVEAFSEQVAMSENDNCSGEASVFLREECISYDGGFQLVPNPRSEYFDLLLTKRVYKTSPTKTPEVVSVVRYHFDGSKFIREDSIK